MKVDRQPLRIHADPTRVVAKPFLPSDPSRARNIVERVLALAEPEVEQRLAQVMAQFAHRHREFEAILCRHFALVAHHVPPDDTLSTARQLLLGAYFTHEYSFEAAALFNPSIVPHPNQAGLGEGEKRAILTFRATAEGHISSLEFRSGILSASGELSVEPPSHVAELPVLSPDDPTSLLFPSSTRLSERVIFPLTSDERNGIEDARWVAFTDDDGTVTYYGSYTAYDGMNIRPKLLTTRDFLRFRVLLLTGAAVRNKGFALFPRKIGGRYAMLGRQDNENNFIMLSDTLTHWPEAHLLRGPATPRELVQIGNNGSPLETEAGWLVLTHGVGPMRQYTLGVELLDLDDPSRLIGRLEGALLAPDESEREGYVPNVVYTCGALLHNGRLIIPYAMSDEACGVATVSLADLLEALGG